MSTRVLIVLFFFFNTVMGMAQPGNPGGDPDIPIDGGVFALIAAGVALGVKKLVSTKRDKI